jgi:hypothetical protein
VQTNLLQQGKFKNSRKMAYLQRTCTETLLEDGLIREVEGGYHDSHRQPWPFPTGRRGDDPKSSGTAWCSSPSMYPVYLCMSTCLLETLMHGMQPVQSVSHHPEQKTCSAPSLAQQFNVSLLLKPGLSEADFSFVVIGYIQMQVPCWCNKAAPL